MKRTHSAFCLPAAVLFINLLTACSTTRVYFERPVLSYDPALASKLRDQKPQASLIKYQHCNHSVFLFQLSGAQDEREMIESALGQEPGSNVYINQTATGMIYLVPLIYSADCSSYTGNAVTI